MFFIKIHLDAEQVSARFSTFQVNFLPRGCVSAIVSSSGCAPFVVYIFDLRF